MKQIERYWRRREKKLTGPYKERLTDTVKKERRREMKRGEESRS